MSYALQQNQTAHPLLFLMIDSSDHISGKTGLSPTVTISKNGGSFASPSGAVTEVANGWYKVAGNATDENTLGPLKLHATATGADPCDESYRVVADDPDTAHATHSDVTGLGSPAQAGDAMTLTAAYNAAKTASQAGDAMALTSSERNSVAAALLDLTDGIETSLPLRGAIRACLALLAGQVTGAGSGTEVFKNPAGATSRVTITVDSSGNRSSVTLNV